MNVFTSRVIQSGDFEETGVLGSLLLGALHRLIGAEGTFHIEELEAGAGLLVMRATGTAPQWRLVELTDGETREGALFHLEPRGRIAGRLTSRRVSPCVASAWRSTSITSLKAARISGWSTQ